MTARLNAASPLSGEMYELYAIAAAVIGGVSLMGGEGRVLGTLIGALIMGTLRNGLNALNVPSALEGMVVGGVLITAVVLDRARHRGADAARPTGWRRYRKLVLAALAFVALTAAAIGFRASLSTTSKSQTLTVAFVPKASELSVLGCHAAGGRERSARPGSPSGLAGRRSRTDVERQYQIIENLIQQRVDAILLSPAGSKELVPAIRKANDAGIPVLLLDTRIDQDAAESMGARVLTYIGSDNFEGGAVAGRYLASRLGGARPRRHHRGNLWTRDRGPTTRGVSARYRGLPGHRSAGQPDRQLGESPRLHGGRESPPGPSRPGSHLCGQRRDGSRGHGGRGSSQSIGSNRHRGLRRDPRCPDQYSIGPLAGLCRPVSG